MRLGSAATVTDAVLAAETTPTVGCNDPRIGYCGVLGGAVVRNMFPPMFCGATGKDPAGLNACDGGTGNEGGGELGGGGEEEGDAEDPVFH